MIPIEEAEKILNSLTFRPQVEEVPLMDSLGRVLASDIVSRISMPPFDKSAMDGYAYISGDDSPNYKVMEIIAAGNVPIHTLQKGQCSKIMTGGMVPPGADRVVKVEVTQETDRCMTITGEDPRLNICYEGEDIKPGDVVLKSGCIIRAPEVGVLASMGCGTVSVYKKSLVSIVTTGSEIKEPGQPLAQGQIYNSNAYSISSQVLQTGAMVQRTGIVEDDTALINQKIDALFKESRMVLISGGVSMGDYDFVPGVLKDLGVKVHFYKVAIQPGKPTIFGTRGDTLVFGMPGNPVSTFIIFEVFVKPLLYRTMGYHYTPPVVKGVMKEEFKRKRTVRTAYIPVRYYPDGLVEPVEYHGSAHLNALARANGLLKIPLGQDRFLEGSTVYVRQI
ncbi:MAG: molybdopterin molybdotransferase MoeA [bacterium]|nr:molybdopterin molybdotransferase MoeA [bacterium]